MLDKALRPFYYHLRHTFMTLRQLVKRRIDDLDIFSRYRLTDICHLLRTLIDQKDDQVHFWMILCDGRRHLL